MKFLVYLTAFLAVAYPVFVWYLRVGDGLVFDANLPIVLFPVLGLAAFSIMWLHVVGGALRDRLDKYFNFQRFVNFSSVAVLLLLILHPLLLLIGVGFQNRQLIFEYNEPKYIWLAIIAWFILVGYDVTKRFKRRDFFMRHWDTVKLISTIGFFFVFFHSFGVGTDLESGPLRYVWIFYGISAAIAAVYSYGIRRFLHRD